MPLSLTAALAAATIAAHQPSDPGLGLGVNTAFPLTVGGSVHLEGPGRLYLRSELGVMPRAYLNTLNDLLVEFDAYDRDTAELIADSLQSALVWRNHLGWRPFPRAGFTFSGGYTLVTLGGRTTAATAVAAATGFTLPAGADFDVDVDATVHQVGGELGWHWRLGRNFSIEAALGGFYTLDAANQLEPQTSQAVGVLLTPFVEQGEAYLDDVMERHLHGGYLSLRGVLWLL